MPLVAAAAITAGGALLANRSNNSAQRSAAQASQAATDQATAEQRRQYDLSRADNAPWLQTGGNALSQLSRLYRLGGTQTGGGNAPAAGGVMASGGLPSATIANGYAGIGGGFRGMGGLNQEMLGGDTGLDMQPYSMASVGGAAPQVQTTFQDPSALAAQAGPNGGQFDTFWQSPDYQFRQNEQARALTARNAALGIQDSGAAQRSAMQLSGNLASSEYNNYANRLAALAGVGQTAAAQNQQLGQSYAGAVGGLAMNNANNLASSYQQRGQNNANLWGSLAGIGTGFIEQRWPGA